MAALTFSAQLPSARRLESDLTPAQRNARSIELLRQARADHQSAQRLRQEVVLLNVRAAEDVAARYSGRGIPIEDLRQVAFESLVRAVSRFDCERDRELLAYAVPTMRGELRRHFRDHGWTIRPPRRVQELRPKVHQVREELTHQLRREPTREELGAALGVNPTEVDEANSTHSCYTPVSLDRPAGVESTATIGDLLGDEGHHGASEMRLVLVPMLERLSDRDRRVIRLRYWDDLSQREIGEQLGISQMQVSRVLNRILASLRQDLAAA